MLTTLLTVHFLALSAVLYLARKDRVLLEDGGAETAWYERRIQAARDEAAATVTLP